MRDISIPIMLFTAMVLCMVVPEVVDHYTGAGSEYRELVQMENDRIKQIAKEEQEKLYPLIDEDDFFGSAARIYSSVLYKNESRINYLNSLTLANEKSHLVMSTSDKIKAEGDIVFTSCEAMSGCMETTIVNVSNSPISHVNVLYVVIDGMKGVMSKPFVISIPKINPAIKSAISIPFILPEGETLDDNKKVIVYVGRKGYVFDDVYKHWLNEHTSEAYFGGQKLTFTDEHFKEWGNIAKRKKEAFEMMDAMYVKIETFIASLEPSDKRDVLDDMEHSVSGISYPYEHNLVLDKYLQERQKAMPSLAPTLTSMINEIKANR